jgi:hypothetical protein
LQQRYDPTELNSSHEHGNARAGVKLPGDLGLLDRGLCLIAGVDNDQEEGSLSDREACDLFDGRNDAEKLEPCFSRI